MFYVYVLKSSCHDNWHYIGSSIDPKVRVTSHNKGKVRSTKGYRPLKLIYAEQCATRSEAFQREMFYKTAAGKAELKKKLKKLSLW